MTDLTTAEKRAELADRGAPYFHKISPGKYLGFRRGAQTWVARMHKPGQDRKHHPIGHERDYDFHAALAAALDWFGTGTRVTPSKLTIRLVLSQYLTYRYNEKSERGYSSTKSLFECHVFPHPIADQQVAKATTAAYQAWLNETGERLVRNHKDSEPDERRRKGRYTANIAWAFFEAALNRAAKTNKTLPKAEWEAVDRLADGETTSRDVFLTETEAQRLVNVTEGAFRNLVLGGLLTGARLGELTAMKVRDINFGDGTWKVAKSKTKRGRNVRYLDQQTLGLLQQLCAGNDKTALVFSPDGEPWRKRVQRHMAVARKKAKLDPATCFYSLRHSYISNQMRAGVPAQAIAENTGTSVKQIEDHYGHFAPSDKRRMLAKGAMKLDVPESNLVALR
jgi:integrase